MGALSIAFDIIIVGALALPGVLLVIHLFFSDEEKSLLAHLGKIKENMELAKNLSQPALAGVLLFAMTYALGSAASRIAQDFFDDDDLNVPVPGRLFRVGLTESDILTDVFCEAQDDTFKRETPVCAYARSWYLRTYDPSTHQPVTDPNTGSLISAVWISSQEDMVGDGFKVQEAKVLLQGTENTERVRQFHDQIMVLRGAAFNGLVAFSLCLFWWIAQFRSRAWALAAPLLYFLPGVIALCNHILGRGASEPPYMEFTLIVLAVAGWYVMWPRQQKEKGGDSQPGKTSVDTQTGEKGADSLGAQKERQRILGYLLLAAFLTLTASLGWWSTQVLYDRQVIYSYKALTK